MIGVCDVDTGDRGGSAGGVRMQRRETPAPRFVETLVTFQNERYA